MKLEDISVARITMPVKLRMVAVLIVVLNFTQGRSDFLDERVKWTGGVYEWPSSMMKNIFRNNGWYVSRNVIATRVAVYNDEAIVALPRYKAGVPATLARLTPSNDSLEATLDPYPCWKLHEEGTCESLQNVVDIYLDPRNILWILDTGVVNILEDPVRKCPPKVLAINVGTGKLLKTIQLDDLTTPVSRLQYVVSDYAEDGRIFVYVSDAASRAILVHDLSSDRSYSVPLPSTVATGCSRQDVLYLAPLRCPDGETSLIFTYLCSSRAFSVRTRHVRRGSVVGKIRELGPKPRRMVFLGTDNGSALFFRYEGESSVYRWDTIRSFDAENFENVYTSEQCYLATHVAADYARDAVRVLESNFPDFMEGRVGCGASQALSFI